MSILIESANILETTKIDAIMHQCNCFHTMGGGVAAALKQKWPEIAVADKKYSTTGDHKKMGTVLPVYVASAGSRIKVIFNCYSQFYFGAGRNTNYEAFFLCCMGVKDNIIGFNKNKIDSHKITCLGVPYNIGCGLGGGDWNIIYSILENTIGSNDDFKVLVCKLDVI
jgi:O-acetyl-ADP-ribose deacetylase (regulator of RNase III)